MTILLAFALFHALGIDAEEFPEGWAIVEGDILAKVAPQEKGVRQAMALSSRFSRWPDGRIPYVVNPDIPGADRIAQAVAEWNSRTPIRLTERRGELDYVRFVRAQANGSCFSALGMIEGEQQIRVDDRCDVRALTHEIGHTVGLLHEHTRSDRDRYLTLFVENIDKRRVNEFQQRVSGSTDLGAFDFASIMIYAPFAFTIRNLVPTMETIPPGIPMAAQDTLSEGDIDAVKRLYGVVSGETTIATNPPGLEVIVDGEPFQTPLRVRWVEGTEHSLSVAADPQSGGPGTRYLFGRWSDDGARDHAITASATTLYVAHFIEQHRIAASVDPEQGGALKIGSEDPDGYYTARSRLTMKAEAADGFFFNGWKAEPPSSAHGASDSHIEFPVLRSRTYTARFLDAPAKVKLETEPSQMPLIVNGAIVTTPATIDAITGGRLQVTAPRSATVSPAITTRRLFNKWNNGRTLNDQVIAVPAEPVSYKAEYRTQHLVVIETSGGGEVLTTPRSTDRFFDEGTDLHLMPSSRTVAFSHWYGDVTGTDPRPSFPINGHTRIGAVFLGTRQIAAVHAATRQPGFVSPGQRLILHHRMGGPARPVTAPPGSPPTTLEGFRVVSGTTNLPLLSVSSTQVGVQLPSVIASQRIGLRLVYNGLPTGEISFEVLPAAPGLYTVDGSGSGIVTGRHEDASSHGRENPVLRRALITLFATGLGAVDQNGRPLLPIRVVIGGFDSEVVGATVDSIIVRVPEDAPAGHVPVTVFAGGAKSQPGTLLNIQ